VRSMSLRISATLHSHHIEAPRFPFFMSFTREPYFNVYWHRAERRLVRVLAETEGGALRILRYHYSGASDARNEDRAEREC
jgi:hypothetical protein